jgi:tetratricopeptide (TPR) repeat protein
MGDSEKSREYMETFKRMRAVEDEASTTKRRATDKMRPVAQILSQVLVDAGRVYEDHQQYDQAEAYWRRAAELDKNNTASRIQLVNRYRDTDRGWEAVVVCEELRRIEPDNARYHFVTGVTLARLKQFDAARDAVRRALELDPDNEQIQETYRQLTQGQ